MFIVIVSLQRGQVLIAFTVTQHTGHIILAEFLYSVLGFTGQAGILHLRRDAGPLFGFFLFEVVIFFRTAQPVIFVLA